MKKHLNRLTGILMAAVLLTSACSQTAPEGSVEDRIRQEEAQVVSLENQKIDIDGVQNARQLGGYICADGKKIKDGVLLRSGALNAMTDEGAKTLADKYNLKYIFDFRMDSEIKAQPDKEVEGAKNMALPVFSSAIYGDKILEEMKKAVQSGDKEQTIIVLAKNNGISEIYKNMLLTEEGQKAYSEFFHTLLDLEEGGSVLWHCTQGKDRAGMAAVLLLYALGADEETIKADYLLTNDSYTELIKQSEERAKELGLTEEETKQYVGTAAGVDEEFLNTAIESVNENYGSVQDYIKNQLGMTDEDINTLRDKFLE